MPLSDSEIDRLATYNAEAARGLVHTAEWVMKMAVLQERYNEWLRKLAGVEGKVTLS